MISLNLEGIQERQSASKINNLVGNYLRLDKRKDERKVLLRKPFYSMPEKLAGSTRLELAASGVTGRRSNQLNYDPGIRV